MKKILLLSVVLFSLFLISNVNAQNVTCQKIYSTQDVHVDCAWGHWNNNYGGRTRLELGKIWGNRYGLGFFDFDLTPIPERVVILNTTWNYYTYGGDIMYRLYDVTQNWNEYTITCWYRPSVGENFVNVSGPITTGWHTLNMIQFIQNHYESDKKADWAIYPCCPACVSCGQVWFNYFFANESHLPHYLDVCWYQPEYWIETFNLTSKLSYLPTLYVSENNTIELNLTTTEDPIPEVNVTFIGENAEDIYLDNELISSPYLKTFTNLTSEILTYKVHPSENFTNFTIKIDYVNETTNGNVTGIDTISYEETPEVRYRYSPITYPLENKTLILQFHYFSGNWDEYRDCEENGNCTYDNTTNKWTCLDESCQLMLNTVKINCRTCSSGSHYQLVQYWTNTTDCQWLNDTLSGIGYWNYPVTMILQDKDVCSDYNLTKDITGFDYKGSLTSMANRDKFVFFNTSRTDQATQYIDYADAINLNVVWDQGTGIAKVNDKNKNKQTETNDIYTVKTEITDSHAKFYIANAHPQTIWLDEIIVPNHLKYQYIQSLDALYTTHGGKRIDLNTEYLSATDEVRITAVDGKIPVEPATGSNILELFGNPSSTGLVIGLLPLLVGVGIVLFVVKEGLTGEWDIEKIVALVITIIVAIALLGVLFVMI